MYLVASINNNMNHDLTDHSFAECILNYFYKFKTLYQPE